MLELRQLLVGLLDSLLLLGRRGRGRLVLLVA